MSENTVAQKPLIDLSEEEVRELYRAEAAKGIRPGLPQLQQELSRLQDAKLSDKVASLTNWTVVLTVALVLLTIGLAVVAGLQLWIAKAQLDLTQPVSTTPSPRPVPAEPPNFQQVEPASFYCLPQGSNAAEGPCFATVILQSRGGAGTEIATFTESSHQKTCQTVIQSTPKGSETESTCAFGIYLAPGTTFTVSESP
jgi:hypothetical protein